MPLVQTPISVIVATRDRHDTVVKTVRSVLDNEYPNFELIVVDQSADDSTRVALEPFTKDHRFRYRQATTEGLQKARNTGAQEARYPIVVATDDDCEVPANWLLSFFSAFTMDSRVAVVFGQVVAAAHDRAKGFIPAYEFRNLVVVTRVSERHRTEGMGACFGFRKDAWLALHGFDSALGRGSRFQSAGETDFSLRALMAGYHVCQSAEIRVLHHGFRTWSEGEVLVRGYLFGVGAIYMKQLRRGHWTVLGDLLAVGWRFLSGSRAVETGGSRNRLLKLGAFLRGAAAGLTTPLNADTGHFAES